MSAIGNVVWLAEHDIAWSELESAYGHELDLEIRVEIVKCLNEYLGGVLHEKRAPYIVDAKLELEKIVSSARRLALLLTPRRKVDAALLAQNALFNHMREGQTEATETSLHVQLTKLVRAGRTALVELDDLDRGTKDGDAWKRWIDRLLSLLPFWPPRTYP